MNDETNEAVEQALENDPQAAETLTEATAADGFQEVFDWAYLTDFLLMMLLCAIVAFLLEIVYKRCGFSLSNRSDFSRNFVLLSCCTMMVVTIVKSSLALSLGLVGALSIVRFRAAIKEPEELCFLFLAIGIGLGFGASVGLGFTSPGPYIPLIAFVFLTGVLWIRKRSFQTDKSGDYHLLVTSTAPSQVGHDVIHKAIDATTNEAYLKRLDESPQVLEASYQVYFGTPEQLALCRSRLLELGEAVSISMMDNRGVGN